MAGIDIEIAGRRYDMACRDGDEPKFRALAQIVNDKAASVARSMGGMGEARQLLFAALLLADARAVAVPLPVPDEPRLEPAVAEALERLAERMEILAARLETDAAIA